jgi:uracil-DNA glycosylase family 4
MKLLVRGNSNPDCDYCELHEYPKSVCVPMVHFKDSLPPGTSDKSILFIGQNPGWNEDQQNEPFVGKSGQLVKEAYIKGCKLHERASIYLTNGVRCHTEANETPKPRHFLQCDQYLEKDIQDIQDTLASPDNLIVVTLGAPATTALWKNFLDERRVSLQESFNRNGNYVSSFLNTHDFTVFSTYHPAAVLRNNNYINAVSAHMQLVSDCLDGVMAQPSQPDIVPTRSPRKE